VIGRPVRLCLCIALVSALTWAVCGALGLGGGTPYGVVIGALMVRPRFDRWPPAVFALLPVVVLLGLGLGTFLNPLLEGPLVWRFAVVVLVAQILAQALPDRLAMVRNVLALLAVLPLLGSNPTWLTAWHQLVAVLVGLVMAPVLQAGLRLPEDEPLVSAEAQLPWPARSLGQRLADPYFLRRLVVSMLSLAIGMGLGATNPKYLYFGVLLLLNDSIGATLLRVRDRMVGVTLGVVMPWVVFNTMGTGSVSVALVMGGTTALVLALRLEAHLRTALISSGVTFVGYGVLTDWYVPSRWLDYLMGSALALIVCVLVRPTSALRRCHAIAAAGDAAGSASQAAELEALLPSALEEARLLGQQQDFRRCLNSRSLTTAGQSPVR
jgi:uncharacterized membrane protein YgaE (UPF0421/DUF939 family)